MRSMPIEAGVEWSGAGPLAGTLSGGQVSFRFPAPLWPFSYKNLPV